MMNLDWAHANKSIINKNLLKELKVHKEVIIFGTGDSGSWAYGLLRENDLEIKAYNPDFIDMTYTWIKLSYLRPFSKVFRRVLL